MVGSIVKPFLGQNSRFNGDSCECSSALLRSFCSFALLSSVEHYQASCRLCTGERIDTVRREPRNTARRCCFPQAAFSDDMVFLAIALFTFLLQRWCSNGRMSRGSRSVFRGYPMLADLRHDANNFQSARLTGRTCSPGTLSQSRCRSKTKRCKRSTSRRQRAMRK